MKDKDNFCEDCICYRGKKAIEEQSRLSAIEACIEVVKRYYISFTKPPDDKDRLLMGMLSIIKEALEALKKG